MSVHVDTYIGNIVCVHPIVGSKVGGKEGVGDTLMDVHLINASSIGREQYLIILVGGDDLCDTHIG